MPLWPMAATTSSSTQPPRYNHGVERRRKLGLTRASSSIAMAPSSSRATVRSTVGRLWPEAL
jgi:hypothetical protein